MVKIFVCVLFEVVMEFEDVLLVSVDEMCFGVCEVVCGVNEVLFEFWFEDDVEIVCE